MTMRIPVSTKLLVALAMTAFLQACTPKSDGDPVARPIKVEVVRTNGKYHLLRDGKPYRINGAGLEFGDVAALARHGGNSFRTWGTDNAIKTGQEVLDEALEHGLTVLMCLWIGHERHGFDYDDPVAVARQFEWARGEVLKYRDHPALLGWIIGNELNFDHKNPKVYDAVNDISRMIHELDPNHPTTTTIAGFSEGMIELIETRAPDIDFLSLQAYGLLMALPTFIAETGFDMPFMVTEWGAIGHWEMPKTRWGAPIEMTSTEKADNYRRAYETAIEPFEGQLIGSYAFLWGQKQERTPTWFGMFTEAGEETEVIDVMHHIWNGEWPDNRSPRLESITLDGKTAHQDVTVSANQEYSASVAARDFEADPLTYGWEIRRESTATQVGGDAEEVPDSLDGLITDPAVADIMLKAPGSPGAYRLFVYVYDGMGHAAHANIPFYVSD